MPPLPVPPKEMGTDQLRPYTTDEITQMQIKHVGVRDGRHPTQVRRNNECTITAEYFCAYAELDAFICHMLGASGIWSSSGVNTLTRMMPQLYPGKSTFFATSVDEVTGFKYTGEQEDDGRPIYKAWLCRVTYQQVPFLVLPDGEADFEYKRFLQELPSTSQADYVTLPNGILKFQKEGGGGPTGNTIQHGIGFINPAVQIRKKWIRIPYDGWKTGSALRARVFGDLEASTPVEPYLGTINKQTVLGYAPGQLLFTGIEEELLLDPALEEQHWNLVYTFLARSVSHDWFKFFDPASSNTGWCFVSNNGTYYDTTSLPDNKSLFNARVFSNLFDVATI